MVLSNIFYDVLPWSHAASVKVYFYFILYHYNDNTWYNMCSASLLDIRLSICSLCCCNIISADLDEVTIPTIDQAKSKSPLLQTPSLLVPR